MKFEDIKPGVLCRNRSGVDLRVFDTAIAGKREEIGFVNVKEVYTIIEVTKSVERDMYPIHLKILSSRLLGWFIFANNEVEFFIQELIEEETLLTDIKQAEEDLAFLPAKDLQVF